MPDPVATGPELPSAVPDDNLLRLLGHPADRRILVLGCGDGEGLVALAAQGARVIGVDPSVHHLERVRARCDEAEVRAELHQADLAELPFLRADTVDAALSAMALAGVDDLDRVFRQAHRVLRPETPLVLSLPHPAAGLRSGRSYFDRNPRLWPGGGGTMEHPRTVGDVFSSLGRANFRVDTLLELASPTGPADLPATLVLRAKKEGI